MTYTLGTKSRANLVGVHPRLTSVVELAIGLSEQDFGVFEGVRTLERQRKLVAAGASRTLRSMHIPQADRLVESDHEYGHAVDLVPWIDGQYRWDWGPCYKIAAAIGRAAREQGVADKMCWGGVWDKTLIEYAGPDDTMREAVHAYGARHPGRDFIDGPHYQIGRLG